MDENLMGVNESEGTDLEENPTSENETSHGELRQGDVESSDSDANKAFAAQRVRIKALEKELAEARAKSDKPADAISEYKQGGVDSNDEVEELKVQINFPEYRSNAYFKKRVDERYLALKYASEQKGKVPPRMLEVAEEIKRELADMQLTDETTRRAEAAATEANKQIATQEGRGTTLSQGTQSVDRDERRRRINEGDMNALTESIIDEVLTEEDIEILKL